MFTSFIIALGLLDESPDLTFFIEKIVVGIVSTLLFFIFMRKYIKKDK